VTLWSKGPRPGWFEVPEDFREVSSFDGLTLPRGELVIATYWTTLAPAAASGARAVHYCQGYEGSYTHNRDDHEAIEAAYRLPLPAMAVAPHLVEMLQERFDRPGRVVTQPLGPEFHVTGRFWMPRRRRPARRPRVLVISPWEIDWKGVETAVRAIEILDRRRETPVELVRVSQWPLPDEELALRPPDRVHVAIEPSQVAQLLSGVDLLLAPSWEQEGFGLPVLEAMARGVPVVASDIPPFRWFAGKAASLVPPRDPEALAAAAAELLDDPRLWRRRRRAGLAAARRFTERRAAKDAEAFLRSALAAPATPA
jgi:glycosyltransferase involved in cell wall biosynthesis